MKEAKVIGDIQTMPANSAKLQAISDMCIKSKMNIFYDGCHKMYLCPQDFFEPWQDNYDSLSAFEIAETFNRSCDLRYIVYNPAPGKYFDLIKQGEF